MIVRVALQIAEGHKTYGLGKLENFKKIDSKYPAGQFKGKFW